MNKLFYIIYNAYYKHGEYKNDNPSLTVGGMFSVFYYSITYSSFIIFHLIKNPYLLNLPKISKPQAFCYYTI